MNKTPQNKIIAVVGVSADQSKYGYKIFRDLLVSKYTVYGVNPKGEEILGQEIYPSLSQLPFVPDLVMTVVPPAVTESVVEDCHAAGVIHIWMQPGSESDAAIAQAQQYGIAVTAHQCFMRVEGLWGGESRSEPSETRTQTAGGVVVNSHGDVLVVNQNNDSWSLPKGHVDPGEDPVETAKREIHEESGVSSLTFVRDLGSYERYKIGLNGEDDTSELKEIHMFQFRTNQMALQPTDPANPEARWVRKQDVVHLLTHSKDKAFFARVIETI